MQSQVMRRVTKKSPAPSPGVGPKEATLAERPPLIEGPGSLPELPIGAALRQTSPRETSFGPNCPRNLFHAQDDHPEEP